MGYAERGRTRGGGTPAFYDAKIIKTICNG